MRINLAWVILVALLGIAVNSFGQQYIPDRFFVKFTDKKHTNYSLSSPEAFLSKRALERRDRMNIAIDSNDLPISRFYLDSLKKTGAQLLNTTKWLNGVVISVDTLKTLNDILAQSFVKTIDTVRYLNVLTKKAKQKKTRLNEESKAEQINNDIEDYGFAGGQIQMLNLHKFYQDGYAGEGKRIAVLDAGFSNVETMMSLGHLFDRNQIKATYDFVDCDPDVFHGSFHGQAVLSIMAARLPGNYLGSAPGADYLLLRTENAGSEYPVEELNWASGAEFADSLGADIINSSLGYTTFDFPPLSYSYQDMNGNTAYSSKAASIASNKGMLVVSSAGNLGSSSWTYVGAPADADSVLTVGAVNQEQVYADFSSIGPNSNGKLKPNVTAVGEGTAFVNSYDQVSYGAGTSFSAPLIAGAAASLWQANPEVTNMELKSAIEKSASQYLSPDALKGYGIPNFQLASVILQKRPELSSGPVSVTPNPFRNRLYVKSEINLSENTVFEITDMKGRLVSKLTPQKQGSSDIFIFNGLGHLSQGIYILRISGENILQTLKIVKA
ncbi:MAG: S8 family serine peptidase [Bacteroidales bacterium]|nr:S8 family serine peptidase [Bacteroidales bacterium]MCF8327981.1 S8 family serine peptidase [Bacteroidales bacterium]